MKKAISVIKKTVYFNCQLMIFLSKKNYIFGMTAVHIILVIKIIIINLKIITKE